MAQFRFAQRLMREVPRAAPNQPMRSDLLALVVMLEVVRPEKATMKNLQGAFGIPIASFVNVVERAEREGLVRRGKNHIDHRETMVELTPEARQLRKRARRFQDEGEIEE